MIHPQSALGLLGQARLPQSLVSDPRSAREAARAAVGNILASHEYTQRLIFQDMGHFPLPVDKPKSFRGQLQDWANDWLEDYK